MACLTVTKQALEALMKCFLLDDNMMVSTSEKAFDERVSVTNEPA